jgi:hypothetical protein
MENQEIAASGSVRQDQISHHGEGFQKALDSALEQLDGSKYAGQKLAVHAFVSITPNPGGVSQYHVVLTPSG